VGDSHCHRYEGHHLHGIFPLGEVEAKKGMMYNI
jgi:hypothetical protein